MNIRDLVDVAAGAVILILIVRIRQMRKKIKECCKDDSEQAARIEMKLDLPDKK